MSKIKYTEEMLQKAIDMRRSGASIPEITEQLGIKKPSLQKLFQARGIIMSPGHKANALARRWKDHEPLVEGNKKCSKCDEWFPASEFHVNNRRLSGLVSSCKSCYSVHYRENAEIIKARTAKYAEKNRELIRANGKNFYESNKEAYSAKAKKWSENNKEKCREIARAYGKRHQKRKNARTAKYRAVKIQATPVWITKEQIDEMVRIYANCPTGYHVDHIVPLRGKGVRGLHVPWNLQYLPALENMSKGNKH